MEDAISIQNIDESKLISTCSVLSKFIDTIIVSDELVGKIKNGVAIDANVLQSSSNQVLLIDLKTNLSPDFTTTYLT